ncbi:uncharacterized protein LOC141899048 [Tubulanus polymorphus]|uniref:uncharacterized protein LOC141899048 n=1 Tax=Tubulanus polymorphus TaxID=672921 RepID=UPI003DA63394
MSTKKDSSKTTGEGSSNSKTKDTKEKDKLPPDQTNSDAKSDVTSLSSSSTTSFNRILSLCQKGDWVLLDQTLRNIDKGNPDLSLADENTGITPLMIAVRENKLVIAERLIDLGANINDKAKDGQTAVHYCAACAKDDMMKLLINRKADATIAGGGKDQIPLHVAAARSSGAVPIVQMLLKVSGKEGRLIIDKDGCIPLFLATEAGNIAVCKELLNQLTEQQVHLQRMDNGDSVLHTACRKRDVDLARIFIDAGAAVDLQNHEGKTALHLAAWEGDELLIKYLYQCKANPNVYDKIDRSPLHVAAERGNTNVVELLVDKFRANVLARTKGGSTLMHIASEFGHPDTALAFLKKGVPLHMPNKSGAKCLHAAATQGHTSVVKALLLKGALVDATTKDAYTALHVAVEKCKPQVVQTLLGFGAEVEIKGGTGLETPLHIAARVKDGEKCAEMLLKSGANVNASRENGETALHIAARHGQLKMINALLEEGADPTAQSKVGETALHSSIRHCHFDVADALIQYVCQNKSRIDAVMLVNQQNLEGETPVHYACELTKSMAHKEFEDTDIIKLLLDFDGDNGIQTKYTQETPLHYCARAGNEDVLLETVKHIGPNKVQIAVNKQAKNGWSPLLVASEQGHLEIVKILLRNHARVDVFDEHGKAALHLCAESGHEEVADVLLWHKAFVNAKSKVGVTPLHLAAQNGYNKLVKLLIETHSATIDALSLAKKTPLHMAAQNGRIEVCSTLLKMNADANATDNHGQTPLHLAAENDHSDVVKLFLKYKPELVTMANTNGMTCAHIAASKGSVAVIKELMRFNKVIVTTARNRTNDSLALHLAAGGGHKEVVRVLLEAGASATDENADGMTAIHLAAKYGHVSIMDVLKSHIALKITSKKTGLTALHVAAHYGQIDFVREMAIYIPVTIKGEQPLVDSTVKDLTAEYALTPLHLAAQSGHESVARLLLNSPGVMVDSTTAIQGAIPLHLAAQNGHTVVASLLLSKSTNQLHVKDKRGRTALNLAAANGHINMVSLLLGQGADINTADKNGWTSLHFAGKAGYLEVVKLLVEGGASPKFETKDGRVPLCYATAAGHTDVVSYLMKKDHSTQHLMDDQKFVFDLMACSKMNNNKSIQEFILLSPAPVDTAGKLSNHFHTLAIKEKERAKDLIAAGQYCEAMATDLLAIASSMGANTTGLLLRSVDCRGTPFLDVLIENEQKEVVAHPAVQKYLSEVWMGNLHWQTWKIVLVFLVFLLLPPIWIAFSLPFKHKYNRVPIIKFLSYLVSHIYFITLLVIVTVYPLTPIWQSGNLIPHWYEWLLLAWFSGLLVSELTNPGDRNGLGWLRVVIIGIGSIGIFTHLMAFAAANRFQCIYIRNQFFASSLLLCFVQLLDFLSFHHLFGPWAIIIRDLMRDLIRFLVILFIFMAGFTFHIAAMYQYVEPASPEEGYGDGTGEGLPSGTAQLNILQAFELLFFSLFGLVEPNNLPPINRNPFWTITLVKAVFGIYEIVTLIVLINLLIAMMSDTYQRIQAQSDTEWKFGRAKLIRNMNRTSATPSPMILITKLFMYLKIAYKHRGKVCGAQAQEYINEEEVLDAQSDSRSVDLLAHTSVTWLRNVMRRGTQVAPEGDFLHQHHQSGPHRIEDVVDWDSVVSKYLGMHGLSEPETSDQQDAQENATNDSTNKDEKAEKTPKENGVIA